MGETLRIRAATLIGKNGRTYNLTAGPIADDVPADVVERLRRRGALATTDADAAAVAVPPTPADPTSVATGGAEGSPGPTPEALRREATGGGGGTPGSTSDALPDDAPDPTDVDTAQLAAYISDGERNGLGKPLNATLTVALARNDPDRVQAVLDAEDVAQGGDSRTTVTRELEKLRRSADGG